MGFRFVGAVVVWGAVGLVFADEKIASLQAALDSIRTDELKQYVDYLADDQREGREAGTRGGKAAGDYLIAQMSRLRLHPAGSEGAFAQAFPPNFRNLLAAVEGTDPKLDREAILVGAHYDHVGYGTSGGSQGPVGVVHPGADDNASGVAGLLELAEAVTRLPQPPRRTIVFAFWDAEEKGMLGAKHWLEHPTLGKRQAVFHLNMDMIGRLRSDRLVVLGTRSAPGLRRLVSLHNEETGLRLDFSWKMAPEADHFPFCSRGIPVLALHTGLHEQYHRPTDRPQLIDAEGMRRVVRLAFLVVHDLANADQVPRFREASRHESEATRRSLAEQKPTPPDKPLRVGIVWRNDDADPGVAVVTYVAPGSPAERAGIQVGDRIYRVGGKPFATDAELGQWLRTLPGPLPIQIERQGRISTREIHFDAAPMQRAA